MSLLLLLFSTFSPYLGKEDNKTYCEVLVATSSSVICYSLFYEFHLKSYFVLESSPVFPSNLITLFTMKFYTRDPEMITSS